MEALRRKTALQPRRMPSQARSRQRVDVILDAVSELLVERGFDAITTRLIAEKADIPVGSIYQFFPNKFAIFNALALRFLEKVASTYQEFVAGDVGEVGWEESLDRGIDNFAAILFTEKAMPVLWAGMQYSAELRAKEAEYIAKGIDFNLVMLEKVLKHVEPKQRRLIAWIMIRILDALFYHVVRTDPENREQAVEELKILLKAYVRSHLESK